MQKFYNWSAQILQLTCRNSAIVVQKPENTVFVQLCPPCECKISACWGFLSAIRICSVRVNGFLILREFFSITFLILLSGTFEPALIKERVKNQLFKRYHTRLCLTRLVTHILLLKFDTFEGYFKLITRRDKSRFKTWSESKVSRVVVKTKIS